MQRRRLGYMKIKEYLGITRFEFIPIDRETALKILKGEVNASEVIVKVKESKHKQ
ncbi:hypothetical protein [Caldivirga maquilingensis]|uniref:hypothetical protein n=1 Tax=Caldivirga maquilingensis TaxID=76887 RepID=UPI0012EA5A7A|nr:hypothetical protein [Caldivirga maquilingensis]